MYVILIFLLLIYLIYNCYKKGMVKFNEKLKKIKVLHVESVIWFRTLFMLEVFVKLQGLMCNDVKKCFYAVLA